MKFTTAISVITIWTFLFGNTELYTQETVPDSPFQMKFDEIKERLYIAYRPIPLRNPVVGSIAFFIGESDVIVFDTGRTSSSASQVIQYIKTLTDNPITHLIISHGHIDHIGGIATFQKEFPSINIISKRNTRNYITERVSLKRYINSIKSNIYKRDTIFSRLQNQIVDSTILASEYKYYYSDMELLKEQYETMDIVAPNLTFHEELTIYSGQFSINIKWIGEGKTQSDIIMHIPHLKSVFVGDMVTHPIPYGFNSNPELWINTLKKLILMDVDYIIPGHGSEPVDKEYVEHLITLLNETTLTISKMSKSGDNIETIIEEVCNSDYSRDFTMNDKLRTYRFRKWFVEPIVNRNYERLKNK